MDRRHFVLSTKLARKVCLDAVASAPDGAEVRITGPRRNLEQNARLWAMLSDISRQKQHGGRSYSPTEWKVLMMHALGREVHFIPSLDEKTFVPFLSSTSDLSKAEMSELIDFVAYWGAENGIEFHEPPPLAEKRG